MQKLDIKLSLPREIVNILVKKKDEIEPLLRRTIALELFREGIISIGKASEIAGVSKGKMLDILGSMKIPIHYDYSDLKEDMETLKKI